MMRTKGISEKHIQTLLVENPKRAFHPIVKPVDLQEMIYK
jgi:hypothetical protein